MKLQEVHSFKSFSLNPSLLKSLPFLRLFAGFVGILSIIILALLGILGYLLGVFLSRAQPISYYPPDLEFTTYKNVLLTMDVFQNSSVDGVQNAYVLYNVTQPIYGHVHILNNSTIEYIPQGYDKITLKYGGPVTFQYSVVEGSSNSNVSSQLLPLSLKQANITIIILDHPPHIVNLTFYLDNQLSEVIANVFEDKNPQGQLSYDSDMEPLWVTGILMPPKYGIVSFTRTQIDYTSVKKFNVNFKGKDSLLYFVTDGSSTAIGMITYIYPLGIYSSGSNPNGGSPLDSNEGSGSNNRNRSSLSEVSGSSSGHTRRTSSSNNTSGNGDGAGSNNNNNNNGMDGSNTASSSNNGGESSTSNNYGSGCCTGLSSSSSPPSLVSPGQNVSPDGSYSNSEGNGFYFFGDDDDSLGSFNGYPSPFLWPAKFQDYSSILIKDNPNINYDGEFSLATDPAVIHYGFRGASSIFDNYFGHPQALDIDGTINDVYFLKNFQPSIPFQGSRDPKIHPWEEIVFSDNVESSRFNHRRYLEQLRYLFFLNHQKQSYQNLPQEYSKISYEYN